ncbi:MAG: DUF934 domain-containing protein [Rhodospirillaceae bacterium]
MALLLKDGEAVCDPWAMCGDDDTALPDGPAIVSLERWHRDRSLLSARNAPLGVRMKSHQLADEIAGDLDRFGLVVLEFPKFRDGRPFSTARALREHHGFTGEIRACGHVIPDQYQFLIRTGFNSVEVASSAKMDSWKLALHEITIAYQGGILDEAPLSMLRRKLEFGSATKR